MPDEIAAKNGHQFIYFGPRTREQLYLEFLKTMNMKDLTQVRDPRKVSFDQEKSQV